MTLGADSIPIIDLRPFIDGSGTSTTAEMISRACRDHGFFYVAGHGIDEGLTTRLEELSRRFFALSLEKKMAIRMPLGGRAWRGYFPVGNELTSGLPDAKEGIYFGKELSSTDPRVSARLPLHGANQYPSEIPELREAVLEYIDKMTALGQVLMSAMAASLGLAADYFFTNYTADPLILFRIFNYPANRDGWGVGEHTDYGLLTILKQDLSGGLEIKTHSQWISAPPIPGTFICNLGDMLDRLTGGLYRSTPHRVRNTSGRDRLSFPFFFDPNFSSQIKALPLTGRPADDREQRWDRESVHEFSGTYGEYLMGKIGKVFPYLSREVL